jgi:CelD/BcsL family acetyltransferase involved in cellulose biosynthesis
VQLTAYNQVTVFEDLKPEWNDLLHRSASDHVFSTWEWQSTWWTTYQAGELWVVACRDDSGHLIGLAPWFIEHNDQGEYVVRSIGCVDVTDYVDVLVEPKHMQIVFTALAQHLLDRRSAYDRVNLCNIPEASPTSEQFGTILQAHGFEVDVVLQEVCPVIELPGTFEDYLGTLDKKQRHEIRRKVRKAESEANISWYIVGPEHNLDEEIERFLGLMSASQYQKAAFLENENNVRFFKAIVHKTFEQGWLQMSFLYVDESVAAAYINFDYQNHILVYNSGLNPNVHGHLSPGIVLLAYNIEHAIETGHTIFDFLRGNETYKYRMGAKDTRVFKLKAQLNG